MHPQNEKSKSHTLNRTTKKALAKSQMSRDSWLIKFQPRYTCGRKIDITAHLLPPLFCSSFSLRPSRFAFVHLWQTRPSPVRAARGCGSSLDSSSDTNGHHPRAESVQIESGIRCGDVKSHRTASLPCIGKESIRR